MFRRTVTADTELAGHRIPTGTTIVYSPYLLHHRPDLFERADRFDPDRWLPDQAKAISRHNFIPLRQRCSQCIGEAFGFVDATLALATEWHLLAPRSTPPGQGTHATADSGERSTTQRHLRRNRRQPAKICPNFENFISYRAVSSTDGAEARHVRYRDVFALPGVLAALRVRVVLGQPMFRPTRGRSDVWEREAMVMSPVSCRSSIARRPASQIVGEARSMAEPVYRKVVDALPAEIAHVASYHIGWWNADGRPVGGSGEAIRPALTLACARAAGGDPASTGALDAAVAVELVHDFSLLHDDVMDGDVTRRHRPAAWAVFGVSQAIPVGDVLLTAAIQQAGTGEGVRLLAGVVQELCAGQSQDLAFEGRAEVTVAECLAMAEAKTGALLGVACQLGALAAGANPTIADWYRRFGRELGLAVQLIDDLLGIWGDPKTTGKPAGSDLVARKKSLPVVAALASGSQPGERLAWLYSREGTLDEWAIVHAATLIEATGGRAWARTESQRRTTTTATVTALEAARPEPEGAADLEALAALLTRWDY